MNKEYQKLIKDGWVMAQYQHRREYYPPSWDTSRILQRIANIDDTLYFTVGKNGLKDFFEKYPEEQQ